VFDPERDDDRGARRFYLRLLAIVVISVAGCIAVYPSVSGFSAGLDGEKGCLAIADGWHADQGRMSAAEKAIENLNFASAPSPEQRVVIDRANAKLEWSQGPGACVAGSRHRLIMSGLGLGGIALMGGGVALARRQRRHGDGPPSTDDGAASADAAGRFATAPSR
jgi:hypothetical protein